MPSDYAYLQGLITNRASDIVEIPIGSYTTDQIITVPSGVTLRGFGDRSLIQRTGAAVAIFKSTSGEGVVFEDLTLDVNWTTNFQAAIWLLNCDGVDVKGCHLYSSTDPNTALVKQTVMGVLASPSSGVTVEGCTFRRLQCILAGSGSCSDNAARYNTFLDANNCAISAVSQGDDAVIDGITIEYNTIAGYKSVGIYIGLDGEEVEEGGTFTNCVVRGNRINGPSWENAAGILGYFADDTRNVTIEDNTVRMSAMREVGLQNSACLYLRGTDSSDGWIDGLRVRGNTLATSPFGSKIICSGKNVSVYDNDGEAITLQANIRHIQAARVSADVNVVVTFGAVAMRHTRAAANMVAGNIYYRR